MSILNVILFESARMHEFLKDIIIFLPRPGSKLHMSLEELLQCLMKMRIVYEADCIPIILPSHENLVHMITLIYLLI